MNNPGLIKAFTASGAIAPYRIAKFGSADTAVLQAAAATDAMIGVIGPFGPASGERVDVIMSGLAEIEYGGTVTRGDLLTSDSSGRAVTAAPSAGANVRIIGIAMNSGVISDIGSVFILPTQTQG